MSFQTQKKKKGERRKMVTNGSENHAEDEEGDGVGNPRSSKQMPGRDSQNQANPEEYDGGEWIAGDLVRRRVETKRAFHRR